MPACMMLAITAIDLAVIGIIIIVAIFVPATAHPMSLSLVSNTSQLFCHTTPSASALMQCAFSEQYLPRTSMALVTSAAAWAYRNSAAIRYFPQPITFNDTNGTTITFPSALIIIGGERQDVAANDCWASADRGKTYVRLFIDISYLKRRYSQRLCLVY